MASRLHHAANSLRIAEANFSLSQLVKAAGAEFVGTLLFVFAATGAVTSGCHVPDVAQASGSGADLSLSHAAAGSCALQTSFILNIALAFGFALFVVIYMTASVSGGHINPAVTLGAFLTGRVSLIRAIVYIIFQCAGALAGSAILKGIDPYGFRAAGGAANGVNGSTGVTLLAALAMEAILTFALVITVFAATDPLRTKDTPHLSVLAPFSIAMVVFFAHFLAVPIDGCSMNPARSFGPAVMAHAWKSHYVFWLGPFAGAIIAAAAYHFGADLPEEEDAAAYQQLPRAEEEA